jgi:glyoxylate utilization-related uncharacterized protein
MKTIKAADGASYDAAKHFNVTAVKKLEPSISLRTTVAVATFQPNGGAEMSSSEAERVYYVIDGSITVKGNSESHTLSRGDLIYIAPGETREIAINGGKPATTLVIIVKS